MYSDNCNKPTTKAAYKEAEQERAILVKELKTLTVNLAEKSPDLLEDLANELEKQKPTRAPVKPN